MNPLFVLGYSKSGTSLLTSLLDGHPEINVIPEESDYFDGMFFLIESIKKNSLSKEKNIDTILNAFIANTHIGNLFKGKRADDPRGNFDYSQFDKKSFKTSFAAFLQNKSLNHDTVLSALAHGYSKGIKSTKKKKYWLEKTPYHVVNVENRETLLDNIFSTYKVVHIFRDPRDNFLSYSKKRPDLNYFDMCAEWNRIVSTALNWKSKSNNIIVKYEDLISKPEETLKKIADFLEIDLNEEIFKPTKNGVPWVGNSMFGTKSTSIDKGRLNRYKKLMPSETQDLIQSCCYNNMTHLGYRNPNQKTKFYWGYLKSNTSLKMKTFKRKFSFKIKAILKP